MDSKIAPCINFTPPNIVNDMMVFIHAQSPDNLIPMVRPNTPPSNKDLLELKDNLEKHFDAVHSSLTKLDITYSQEIMTKLGEDLVHATRSIIGTCILLNLPFIPLWNEIQRSGMCFDKEDYPDSWNIVHQVWQAYAIANPPKPMSPPDINGDENKTGKLDL